MKITKVQTAFIEVPADEPLADGPQEKGAVRKLVGVKISTDQGLQGISVAFFGAAITPALKSAIDSLGALTIGMNPLAIEAIHAKLREAGSHAGPGGDGPRSRELPDTLNFLELIGTSGGKQWPAPVAADTIFGEQSRVLEQYVQRLTDATVANVAEICKYFDDISRWGLLSATLLIPYLVDFVVRVNKETSAFQYVDVLASKFQSYLVQQS